MSASSSSSSSAAKAAAASSSNCSHPVAVLNGSQQPETKVVAASALAAAPFHSTLQACLDNQERCRALQECQVQLKFWKAKYTRLKQEHKRVGRLQAISSDAATAWSHLSAREKQSREYILAALHHSPTLPAAWKSAQWWHSLPANLQGDVELWQARLQRLPPSCIPWSNALEKMLMVHHHTTSSSVPPHIAHLWQQFLVLDPTLLYIRAVQEFLGHYPDLEWVQQLLVTCVQEASQALVAYEAQSSLLQAWELEDDSDDEEEDGQAFLCVDDYIKHGNSRQSITRPCKYTNLNNSARRRHPNTNTATSPLRQRALALRSHKPFITALWKRPVWTKTKRNMMSPTLRNDKEFCLSLVQASESNHPFPPDALHALSSRLRADIQVVRAYCQRHGANVALASYGLRRHYQVVTQAVQTCPRALLFCLNPALKRRFWNNANELWELVRGSPTVVGRRCCDEESSSSTCDLYHDCPTDKYAPGTQAAVLYQACPPDIRRRQATWIAAARVGAVPPAQVYTSCPYVHKPDFWKALWAVTTTTNDQPEGPFAAFCRPYFPWRSIPLTLQSHEDLATSWLYYHGVHVLADHAHRKKCLTVANAVEESVSFLSSVEHILNRFTHLAVNERFLRIVLTSRHPIVPTLLADCLIAVGGLNLLHHRDLVLEGCRANGYLLAELPLPLLLDGEILQTALSHCPGALTVVPGTVQIMFPTMVATAMSAVAAKIRKRDKKADGTYTAGRSLGLDDEQDEDHVQDALALERALAVEIDDDSVSSLQLRLSPYTDYFDLYEAVHEDLWQNRQVALAWIRAGGSFLHDEFPETFEDDEEFALALAEFSPSDFMFVSDRLLGDATFMRKAIAIDGSLLRDASDDLPFDLTLLAFASKADLVKDYDWTDANSPDFKFLTDLAKRVRSRLLQHEGFVTFLHGFVDPKPQESIRYLTGILSPLQLIEGYHSCAVKGCDVRAAVVYTPPQAIGSPVGLLRCGKETSYIFKRSVADFVGIPMGEELRLLRRCSHNLQRWGF